MRISIPKDIGGGLKVLPDGVCRAAVDKVSIGKSKEGQPKATVKYICLTEMYPKDAGETSVGETILETFSLQPQALWRLNDMFNDATGENLPQGDYDETELGDILERELKGTEWELELEAEEYEGNSMTRVQARIKL